MDPDTAAYLAGEDRFNHRASGAWRDSACCAFYLGHRGMMTDAYDRELLLRLRPAQRQALRSLREAIAPDRAEEALVIVRRDFRFAEGGTPEIRSVLTRTIDAHVVAKRFHEAVAIHHEILEAIATTWGRTSGVHVAAKLDLARLLIDAGWIDEARPVLEELTAELDDVADEHPLMEALVAARTRLTEP